MRKILSIIIISGLFLFNTTQAKTDSFHESYEARDLLTIKLDIGSLALISDTVNAIVVRCESDLSGDAFYKPSVATGRIYWNGLISTTIGH